MPRPALRSRLLLPLLGALFTAGLSAAALAATAANGDVLLIDRIQAEPGIDLPQRGERMDAVRAKFGEPSREIAAVGGGSPQTPPITRWVYAQFTVYFENQLVVNAVLNKASTEEIGPKPVH